MTMETKNPADLYALLPDPATVHQRLVEVVREEKHLRQLLRLALRALEERKGQATQLAGRQDPSKLALPPERLAELVASFTWPQTSEVILASVVPPLVEVIRAVVQAELAGLKT
jgi:hypothetical protein